MIAEKAIKIVDFTVIYGHRDKQDQDAAFIAGNSKFEWPKSKHNTMPSMAMDLAPYPIDWTSKPAAVARFYLLGGIIKSIAYDLGIEVRAGWDWNMDWDLSNNKFNDLGHYELINPR